MCCAETELSWKGSARALMSGPRKQGACRCTLTAAQRVQVLRATWWNCWERHHLPALRVRTLAWTHVLKHQSFGRHVQLAEPTDIEGWGDLVPLGHN